MFAPHIFFDEFILSSSTRSTVVGCKIYCGNLSYNFSKADLEELFAPFGDVRSADVIMDRDTGRSKGFGFVEMADSSDAQKAIQALNDSMVDGRPLKVNEAKPREERSGAGGRGGGGGGYNRGGGGGGGRRY
jgi:cold-inducible RNA-binding protein